MKNIIKPKLGYSDNDLSVECLRKGTERCRRKDFKYMGPPEKPNTFVPLMFIFTRAKAGAFLQYHRLAEEIICYVVCHQCLFKLRGRQRAAQILLSELRKSCFLRDSNQQPQRHEIRKPLCCRNGPSAEKEAYSSFYHSIFLYFNA